jgi:hypothetical protein
MLIWKEKVKFKFEAEIGLQGTQENLIKKFQNVSMSFHELKRESLLERS